MSASIAALLVGVPTLRAFISPGLKAPEKKGWIKVGQVRPHPAIKNKANRKSR